MRSMYSTVCFAAAVWAVGKGGIIYMYIMNGRRGVLYVYSINGYP